MAIGRLGRPHGIRGEIRLDPQGTMPRGLDGYSRFFVADARGQTKPLDIAGWRPVQGALLLEIAGISDRDEVGRLTGLTLYVPREDFPELPEGEHYHADMIGLRIVDRAGVELGVVEDVRSWGEYDMLFVRTGAKSWMIPFVGENVVEVRPPEGVIIVDLPEGLVP